MKARLAALLALLLPELPLDPARGGLEACLRHPLGTDLLGRDGLLRLGHATARGDPTPRGPRRRRGAGAPGRRRGGCGRARSPQRTRCTDVRVRGAR